jgi:ABC-2 type transport system ATP-binding protein
VDRDALATSALVPQDYAFYASLTGRENLECFAGIYGLRGAVARERVIQATEICGLGSILNRRASLYSGGVKRRLNLAIGLLNRPAILYLDEPTVGIDAQSRRFILDSILGLRKSGMTIVYTSHYMEEIQFLCDDVAVIDHGELRLQGTLDGLLHAASARTARLTLSGEPGPDVLAALGQFGAVTVQGREVRMALADGRASLTELLAVLAVAGLSVEQCEFGRSQLEDIYLAATARQLRE